MNGRFSPEILVCRFHQRGENPAFGNQLPNQGRGELAVIAIAVGIPFGTFLIQVEGYENVIGQFRQPGHPAVEGGHRSAELGTGEGLAALDGIDAAVDYGRDAQQREELFPEGELAGHVKGGGKPQGVGAGGRSWGAVNGVVNIEDPGAFVQGLGSSTGHRHVFFGIIIPPAEKTVGDCFPVYFSQGELAGIPAETAGFSPYRNILFPEAGAPELTG